MEKMCWVRTPSNILQMQIHFFNPEPVVSPLMPNTSDFSPTLRTPRGHTVSVCALLRVVYGTNGQCKTRIQ